MSSLLGRVRDWLGLDKKTVAEPAPAEEIARAEDEGMTAPDVEVPSPSASDQT